MSSVKETFHMFLVRNFLANSIGTAVVLGGLVLVLSGFNSRTMPIVPWHPQGVSLLYTVARIHSKQILIVRATQNDCPDAPPLNSQAQPLFHFCSPKFA